MAFPTFLKISVIGLLMFRLSLPGTNFFRVLRLFIYFVYQGKVLFHLKSIFNLFLLSKYENDMTKEEDKSERRKVEILIKYSVVVFDIFLINSTKIKNMSFH